MDNDKHTASVPANAGSSSGAGPRPSGVLPAWRDTLLAASQYFYPLPAKILDEIGPLLDQAYCQGAAWQLERQTSQTGVIGFWNGHKPLGHPLLQRLGAGRADGIRDLTALAYCGWLGSCCQFLREHDDLLVALQQTMDMIDPQVVQHGPLHALSADNGHLPAEPVQCYQAFCQRWRLEGLIGPYLPVPARLTHQVLTEPGRLDQHLPAGLLLHIPDTYGPLTRSHLVQIQKLMVDGKKAQHLAGWHRIVHSSNRNRKKQLGRYARSFLLRHYWNTLFLRHSTALCGQIGQIRLALADMLHMKLSTVRWNLRSHN